MIARHYNKYSTEVPAKLQHYSAEYTLNILINYKCIKCWQNNFSDKILNVDGKTMFLVGTCKSLAHDS
jgi:hypothetical protein